MHRVLLILTHPENQLAEQLALRPNPHADRQVETVDLTVARPDYDALVDLIFAADSVQVY